MQLRMLVGLTRQEKFGTLYDLATFMSSLHAQTRGLFKDVGNLLHLALSLPISVASSERSFSALRRLKTWLRNTVVQRRLTHLALLHICTRIFWIHWTSLLWNSSAPPQNERPPLESYHLLKFFEWAQEEDGL
ncbi:unnamed protein product [Arctogadus glacialis]